MFYDAVANTHGLQWDPFKALVSPRPIGWISTLGKNGVVNLAPYSFFNAVATDPHFVMFSSGGRKDSQRNAEETGEFVCSLATYDLRDAMNRTSQHVSPEVDEMVLAGLTPAPSKLVAPPRVAESPVAFECKYWRTIDLPGPNGGPGTHAIVLGQVIGVHIDDRTIVDGKVDVTKLKPIARLGYGDYAVIDQVFELSRPQ
ncbi:flavin reductase [Methyloceanibacter marginalis]|mgnify:CR=1 FL=1|jgi:flavin reductase (DIM6/NTAB) family NADH-FMN oxidoreductase RutF|uniref:Flavin reductase n=1 Tax=Methyloceanibacter marginalis TaxID=1774971 RepID=A0A1E3WCL1_9HYPH|nr:flavin reductase family protein [Methyloceanibacter marginalis]ODS03549.1 flavin reductase [Methyloceanibacter marginalis]